MKKHILDWLKNTKIGDTSKRTTQKTTPKSSFILPLEQRIMFDGSAVAVAADTAHHEADAPPPIAVSSSQDNSTTPLASSNNLPAVEFNHPVNQARHEIIVIDTSVENYQTLLENMSPEAEIIYIHPNEDALQVLAHNLEGRSGIDAIHIISHGMEGSVHLGNEWLDTANLASHADLLSSIGNSLSDEGDILLYGCNIGAGEKGAAFLTSLSSLTGADVAASNDPTGAARFGGDWALEIRQGPIETSGISASASYNGLLAISDQDFDSIGSLLDSTGTSLVVGDWTFTAASSSRFVTPDQADYAVNLNVDGSGSDRALIWNLDGANITSYGLKSTDGTNFNLNSFRLGSSNGSSQTVTVSGWRDGSQVVSDESVNLGSSDSAGNITFSAGTDIGAGKFGLLTFGAAFDNVDEIRLVFGAASTPEIDDIDISPADNTPAISNLNGDSVAWAGVGSTVVLDASTNASLTDTEFGALNSGNGNWSGGSLSVQRSGTAISSDTFGFNTSGALFTVSGSNLQSGGLTFATFTNTGGVLAITATSSGTAATTALVNDVAHRITYRNDTPSGDATVRFTLSDGNSSTTADVTVTSDTIYVTNSTDTSTIDITNGVSFGEAIGIAAADATGSQTIAFASSLASTSLTVSGVTLNESLTFDMDSASGMSLTTGTINIASGTLTLSNGTSDTATISGTLSGSGALTKSGAGTVTLSNATNSFTGATTVSAGTLTLSGGNAIATGSNVTVSSGATLSLSASETIGTLSGAGSITLGANTLTSNLTADTTFSGGISGTGGLQVTQSTSATFALTLSGTNTYTGNTTAINFGWLKLNGDASVSSSSSLRFNGNGKITLLSDQTVGSLNSVSAVTATLDLGSFTLTTGGDGNSTSVAGVIAGTGSLVKQGGGTMSLDGTNTYTGTTTVSAGTLSVASDSNLGSGAVTLSSGSILDVTGATTIDNSIVLGGNATINNSAAVTMSGVISGSANLTKSGSSTLTLSNTNTYTGTTTVSAGTLSIGSDANLGSGTVTLATGTTLAITGSTTIDNAITLSGNATIDTSANATVSGNITGSANLTKTGGSTLTLSGTNSYTGTTTISNGTVSVAGDSNLGAGTITLDNSTLDVTSAATIDNAITLANDGTINNSAATTLSGQLSGSFRLSKTGAGDLTLANSSNSGMTGEIAMFSANLLIANGTYMPSTVVLLGGNLTFTAATTVTSVIAVQANSTITNNNNVTISNNLELDDVNHTLTKAGSGVLTFSSVANSSFMVGKISIQAGTLSVSDDRNLSQGDVTIDGGTLAFTATDTYDNNFILGSSNATIDVSGSAVATLSGTVSSTGTLTKTGTGTLKLSGTNTYTSTTTVNAGTLSVASDSNLGSGSLTLGTGTTLAVTGATTIDNAIALSGDATVNNTAAVTLSGAISGSSQLTKSGSSTLTLSSTSNSASSWSSNITAGTLSISATTNLGTGTITLNNGTLTDTNTSTETITNDITIGTGGGTFNKSSGTLTLSGTLGGSGSVTNSGSAAVTHTGGGTLTLDGASVTRASSSGALTLNSAIVIGSGGATFNTTGGDITMKGNMSGSGTLTKQGGSSGYILWLYGNNTHSGTQTVSSGWLVANSATALGTGQITLSAGTTLGMNGGIATFSNNIVLAGDATIQSATPTNTVSTFTGVISESGGSRNLTIGTGSGTSTGITLSGTNTYTGTTTVTGSNTFRITDGTNISASTLTLSGAIFQVTGSTVTLANSMVIAGNSTISNANSLTLSGVVSGSNSLTKTGAGTLTLSNTNTHSGGLTVSAGNLSLTGSKASGTITVASGGTLSGTGTQGGAVTVQSGGTFSPGISGAGTFTVGNGLTIQSGGTLAVDIAGATAGSGYDQVLVTGAVNVTSATITPTHSYTSGVGDSYTIISNDASDAITGTFSGLAEGGTVTASGNSTVLTASYVGGTGNDFILTAPVNPVVQSVSASTSNGTYKIGDTISITVTFDQAVTVDTTGGTPTIQLETGSVDRTASYVSGSGSTTLVFSYTIQAGDTSADLDYVSTSALALNGGTIKDGLSNDANLTLATPGAANSLGANKALVVDGVRPTASLVVADNNLKIGETSLVTITFNEAVTGFTTADLSVANGIVSGLSSSDGGVTWTATLTPTSSIQDATNVITLDNTGVTDAAGNTGTGTTNSNNYAIDTARPTATIVVTDTALKIGETSLVTITFSESVSGFTTADLTVDNGVVSGLSSSDGGVTWTATLTPNSSITDTTNLITLDNTGLQDAAGNTGTGTTDSNNYAIDTVRPTATIVVADTALKAGETSLVTFTFSEAVTAFTTADLTVANGVVSGLSSSDGGITWTATLTPTTSITDTTNLITLDNTGVQDAAGNTGSGTTDSNNYAIDTARPTATIVVADTALKIGETSLVTITFSESVSGFTTADLSVDNGVVSGLSSSDGGVTWTATLTPTASITDTTNLITLDNTGLQDAAGNTGSGTTDSNNYAIDTVRPTATIVVADTALKAGETSLVTFTFSEAVTAFTTADLTVANGVVSGLSSSDGGITWTATLTPTTSITDTTNVITLDNTGLQDAAGNTGTGTTDSNNYAIDTVRPTATIVVADTALKAGETSLVTFTFSEAVTAFTTADLTVANGVVSGLSSSDGGITWTATFTPTTSITDTTNLITLDNTGVQDAAGNTGSGTTDSNNYAIDTARPTATIVVADNALSVGETSLVTITFSEAVTGFTNADLTIANGTLSAVSSSDGGITWTATFTPTVSVTDTTNVITLDNTGVQDAAGNTGTGSTNSNNYAIDTVRPTASIVVADTSLGVGETSLVTITFSEAVTGFTNADLTIANGTLSAVSSSDGGITWTATLTPTNGIADTTNIITLANTGVQDVAGNTGTGTTDSNNYAIDTARPTATIVVADNALAVGETSLVTFTFSEAVTGFTNADLTIANGTLNAVSSSDGGITWTATFTPTADITDTTNVITLANTGVQDAAGNTGTGSTDSNNYAIDTARPTATIVVTDNALSVGETSLVTFTFSEAVTGFTNADLTIANGTLSAVSSSDGGITWTATFTPTADITDTTNVITLANTGVQDAAGNTGTGSTDSNNYAIDTLRPTASIFYNGLDTGIGEVSSVTITFNEAITGLTPDDFTIANGHFDFVLSYDSGITWTAYLVPDSNIEDTTNIITLDNAGVQDAAGNTGTGTTDSNNYAIDTKRPTATIVVADNALAVGESSLVTFTFSEAATGFTNADLTIANGTLSAVSSSDGGITWTATFTPTVNITDTTNLITLSNSDIADLTGNAGAGTTDSNNYTIDTARPTATIVVADNALAVGETSLVTFTFSEAVTGFTNADLTIANGTLSAVSSSDGGITWTATFTPTANITDTTNLITLSNSGVADLAGNAGTGSTDSNNFGIDSTAPTVNIQLQGSPQPFAQSVNFTVTFNEAVQHVEITDFNLTTVGPMRASLGSVQQVDDHTWTVTVNSISGNGVLLLNTKTATDITDNAGNALSGTSAGATFTAQSLPSFILPISTPLVIKIADDAPLITQAASPLIVLSPDASQVGGATNSSALTTVEAPALATVVNPISPTSMATITSFAPIGSVTTSVFAANTTPTALDTSTPGTDPIGVATATSTGTASAPATGGGIGHLGTSGNYTATNQTYSPTIERLTSTADNSLQGLPIVARAEMPAGVPVYIPIPTSAPSLDPHQQISVEVRMQDGRPLVSWMRFDPVTGSLSGQAPKGFEGKLQIQIIVRDSKGNSVSSIMELQFSDKDKTHQQPTKPVKDAHKPGAHIMGKPALHEQFARYGTNAHKADADAILSALNQISLAPTVARKA